MTTTAPAPAAAAVHHAVADWRHQAACAQPSADPEVFFGDTARSRRDARRICARCPVHRACLADAMQQEHDLSERWRHGIRAGLSGWQRWQKQKGAPK